jgi:hypothetical protein
MIAAASLVWPLGTGCASGYIASPARSSCRGGQDELLPVGLAELWGGDGDRGHLMQDTPDEVAEASVTFA